ncbi:hypothetical protein [Lewinella sp. 4G2]|uniref:hypothetical protein n=1 Tax=Lewinella sp. 4G2 TaxID=1803372 RepID=UPI0007B48026|nr:hypothetical protein [Lewinella sp. 4G2]OAV44696.1 hypothetical protein A3850_009420 [Lewinella sp. 4G2]
MKIFCALACCLLLFSCNDEIFEPIEPVPQDIFDPELKPLFIFNRATHPNRAGGFKVVILDFSVYELRIPVEQEDLLRRIQVMDGEREIGNYNLSTRSFIDETRRRSGSNVCYTMSFLTTDGRESRASELCLTIN